MADTETSAAQETIQQWAITLGNVPRVSDESVLQDDRPAGNSRPGDHCVRTPTSEAIAAMLVVREKTLAIIEGSLPLPIKRAMMATLTQRLGAAIHALQEIERLYYAGYFDNRAPLPHVGWRMRHPLDYGRCERCGKRMIPDVVHPDELLACIDEDCAYFVPNGTPIKPSVEEI